VEARRRSAWWQDLARPVKRAVARHRRGLAAIAAGLAVLSALSTLRPAPPDSDRVAVAAQDLRGGTRLTAADIGMVDLPPAAVPDGAYAPSDEPVGRLLAAPVRRGEPLTDAAVVGPGLASSLPSGQVLTSIQVAATTALLVRPGDLVDVIAGGAGAVAEVVAGSATVIAVPRAGGDSQTRAVVLAVDETAALSVAQAALVAPLQVVVRPP
jgi:Flp pilus assembly protein CpaB